MSISVPFSSKCIHEVDSIFRMTTFVKYTGTVVVALTIVKPVIDTRAVFKGDLRVQPPEMLKKKF